MTRPWKSEYQTNLDKRANLPLAKSTCSATNNNGNRCYNKARYGGYCRRHALILTDGFEPSQTAR